MYQVLFLPFENICPVGWFNKCNQMCERYIDILNHWAFEVNQTGRVYQGILNIPLLICFTRIPAGYKHADGKKIDGRRVLVDVERGRTVKGWLPRRLGEILIFIKVFLLHTVYFRWGSWWHQKGWGRCQC